MKNIVLFGPPGSGKGTQANNIISKYHLIHLSTGDMLRAEIAAHTPLGLEAKSLMDQGQLVPDSVVIGMIENKLDANPKAKGFVFDGFPRTVGQAEALDALLKKRKAPIRKVLSLKVSEEELTRRILDRGLTSGRTDDQDPGIVKNRVAEYRMKTEPLANYYAKQGKLTEIQGEGTVDHIFDMLSYEIDSIDDQGTFPIIAEIIETISGPGGQEQVVIESIAIRADKVPFPFEEKMIKSPKKAPAKKAVKKSSPEKKAVPEKKPAAKKTAKKAAPKKAAKKAPAKKVVAKKPVKKATPKKAVKKVAPKKAIVKKASKKAAPKKAAKKAAKKAVKKAVKKVAPKKAVRKAAPKKVVRKAAPKKVVKKAAKKAVPKKAVKKAVKKAAPKKAAKKAAPKKAIKKAAPKKAVKKAPAKKKGRK